jgi:hypothetical protein
MIAPSSGFNRRELKHLLCQNEANLPLENRGIVILGERDRQEMTRHRVKRIGQILKNNEESAAGHLASSDRRSVKWR